MQAEAPKKAATGPLKPIENRPGLFTYVGPKREGGETKVTEALHAIIAEELTKKSRERNEDSGPR